MSNERKKHPIFSAMIPWPFMMVVQVHHPWWESIVVIQFLPAMSRQAMRSWFILKLTGIMTIIMVSKWNIIQQVTHQLKTTLNIMGIIIQNCGSSLHLGKYCGVLIPPSHISFSNEILVYLLANHWNSNYNGFKLMNNPTNN